MMRPSNDLPVVFLCRDIVDFRKGINGLAILVEDQLEQDPFSEQLFVFCNRKRDGKDSLLGIQWILPVAEVFGKGPFQVATQARYGGD